MDVDWGTVQDVVNVVGVLLGVIVIPLLVLYLKKYFPGREELANYLTKDRIEILYVSKKSFKREMHRLRTDLQTQLGASAAHTDGLLRDGFRQVRNDINGQSTRISAARSAATVADAKADSALELLRRTEADFGRLDEKMDGVTNRLNTVAESLGHIKGLLEKDR